MKIDFMNCFKCPQKCPGFSVCLSSSQKHIESRHVRTLVTISGGTSGGRAQKKREFTGKSRSRRIPPSTSYPNTQGKVLSSSFAAHLARNSESLGTPPTWTRHKTGLSLDHHIVVWPVRHVCYEKREIGQEFLELVFGDLIPQHARYFSLLSMKVSSSSEAIVQLVPGRPWEDVQKPLARFESLLGSKNFILRSLSNIRGFSFWR